MILCFTCVLAYVPALIMDSKLRVGLRKYYTKEKVSGELLTNAEQRTSMRAGGGVARHTHTHTNRSKRQCCMPILFTHLPSASNIT